MRKALLTVTAVGFLLLLVVLAGGWFYLRTSLPKVKGVVQIDGLASSIEIVRDADGVPHIFAETDNDAVFGLGYVHAQDRMWQLELNRRIGAGRLSEILGEPALEADKFLRTLGVYRSVQESWPALNADTQAAMEAYAAGINAWLQEDHTLPPEFHILGVRPEPWTVFDSLVWAKILAWDLGGDYDLELLRVRLVQALGPERAAQILPAYPADGLDILAMDQVAAPMADGLLELDSMLQKNFQLRGLDVGSNNWVVAGSHTDTQQAMLANDPHLGARIPSIWYLAEMEGDRLHVVGATLPAMPAVIIGHNEHIAWGVTNVGADVQDLYMERINAQNPNQYEVDGKWTEMEIIEEPILVKGESEPLRWAARRTRHGPLISDVLDTASPVALRWTALEPDDTTLNAFLSVNRATNWAEFRQGLSQFVVPSLNFVYADMEGNIGYIAPGRIPIRALGEGMFPVPGWDSAYEWTGWIAYDELPQVYNPAAGYIATANNRIVSDDYPYLISNAWAEPYRAERIVELIEEMSGDGETISLHDMRLIQGDQVSKQARALLPFLLAVTGEDERQKSALERLQGWDGHVSRASVAASIYEAWYVHLGRAMFEDDLSGDLYEEMAERNHPIFLQSIMEEAPAQSPWCDNVLTTPIEDCSDTARLALDQALDDLEERLGEDMDNWQWGKILRTYYPHNPFSEVSLLRPIFERSIENGGDKYTVNVSPIRLDRLYDQTWVPSYRQLITMADLNQSLFMHTTGQSGNLLSRHYDDLIERHRDVEYLSMLFGRERADGDVLRLEPR